IRQQQIRLANGSEPPVYRVAKTPASGGDYDRPSVANSPARANGTAIRRLTNVEAVFVIQNTGNRDSNLRASLTAQLSGKDAGESHLEILCHLPEWLAGRGAD
ncbi:MAG: hypothetical protein ACJ8AW_12455, partial [Rhodopila sp.]